MDPELFAHVMNLNSDIKTLRYVLNILQNNTTNYNQLQKIYWVLDRLCFTAADVFVSPDNPKDTFTCKQFATTKWKVNDLCRIAYEYFDKKHFDEPIGMETLLFSAMKNVPDTFEHLADDAIEKYMVKYNKFFPIPSK